MVLLAIPVLPMTAQLANALDPIENWPELRALLHGEADKRPVMLSRGSRITLDARTAVLAPDLSLRQVLPVNDSTVRIPANGVLTFALDVSEPMYVTGFLSLAADPADLRPGLRAYILSDTTVVGAPMIFQEVPEGHAQIDFDLPGNMPDKKVKLATWRLEPGRHYVSIAGPHYRAGGDFKSLELQGLGIVPESPTHTFSQFADTHIGYANEYESEVHRGGQSALKLGDTLDTLRQQGVAYAIIAGDMTDDAKQPQFTFLANAIAAGGGLEVYGCVGNHDSYHPSSRPELLETCPDLFPGGKTNYVLHKPPLRFIVVDAANWMTPEGKVGNIAPRWDDYYRFHRSPRCGMGPDGIKWFRRTLAADTTTLTVVVSHFPFSISPGKTPCGYVMDVHAEQGELQEFVKAAPNVVATISGHFDLNHVETFQNDYGDDVTSFQGPPFCSWPGGYRVFRVYTDGDDVRLEWETRLVDNMGYVSTAEPECRDSTSLSWRISTGDDLAGQISLRGKE